MGNEIEGQQSLDEALVDTPQVGAQKKHCIHCFVVAYDAKTNTVATVCAHRCGAIKEKRSSVNPEEDLARAKRTQEAFVLAHVRGCPRDRRRFYSMIP